MKATVSCTVCGYATEVESDTLAGLGSAIESAVVGQHAICSKHQQTVTLGGQVAKLVLEGDTHRELLVECLQCPDGKLETAVPPELVGAMTLLLHTAHEGHPMRVTYDGRSWQSPQRPVSEKQARRDAARGKR